MKFYSHEDMHARLIEASGFADTADTTRQAGGCPYYIPLAGILGSDWGVVVNPASSRFGLLTFEHDDCGCSGPNNGARWSYEDDADLWWIEETTAPASEETGAAVR